MCKWLSIILANYQYQNKIKQKYKVMEIKGSRTEGMAQVLEYLLIKCKALSSYPSISPAKKK